MVNKFTQWSPIEELSALFIQRPNPSLVKKKIKKKNKTKITHYQNSSMLVYSKIFTLILVNFDNYTEVLESVSLPVERSSMDMIRNRYGNMVVRIL
jgi:hypothetical protein